MATVIERTAPRMGSRMILVAAASLLLGGFAAGLVGSLLDSDQTRATPATLEAFSPEAIRAKNYTAPVRAEAFSPEAIRAKNWVAP